MNRKENGFEGKNASTKTPLYISSTSKHYKKALSTNHMVKQPTGTGVILYSSELQTTMVGNKSYELKL